MSSTKKIKLEPLITIGKRKYTEPINITQQSVKKTDYQYYCCIHADKDICDVYQCNGVNSYNDFIYHTSHLKGSPISYIN